jgi:hypothetical protein
MTINLADNTPRVSYAVAQGATQTSFTVSFEFFDAADLNVYVDGTLKTITTHYTVSGGDGSTGTVTMSVTGATGGSTVVITRDIDLKRTTDFPASGSFQIGSLNTELDKLVAIAADLDDKASRALQLTDFDTAVSLVLPDVNTRKGKTLAFNASTGAVEAGPSTSDVQTVSATAADIATLADIEDGTDATDAIQTVAGIASNVTTVAGVSSNVTTVAGQTTNMQNITDNLSAVQNAATNATTATTKASEAATSATNAASSATSAASSATTATTKASEASTSATNSASSASTASGHKDTATTKASEAASSATAAAASASTASTQASNASTSASTASTQATNSATSATASATSATASATSATASASSATAAAASQTAAASSAAAAASSFDSFDDRYLGPKSSNPSQDNDGNALVSGALYFNSTANEMRVYDGANWIAATSAGNVSLILYEYTATSNQTTFSGSDDNSATLSYTVDNLQVVMNGVILDPSDYTASNGTSVVLASGAATNDLINIYAFKSFTTADMVSKTNGGTFAGAVGFTSGFTASDGCTITTADNSQQLSLISTDADANVGPELHLRRNSASPANNDAAGEISFNANNDAGQNTNIVSVDTRILNVADGTEEGGLELRTMKAGSMRSRINMYGSTTVINDDSQDIDFRVESDGDANAFFVEGSSGNVGIGTASISAKAHIQTASSGSSVASSGDELFVEGSGDAGITVGAGNTSKASLFFADDGDSAAGRIRYDHSDNSMQFGASGQAERMRIDSSGNVLVGKTATNFQSVGVEAKANGSLWATADGNGPLIVVRKSNDGTLIQLYKNTAKFSEFKVTDGDNLSIDCTSTNHAGLTFAENSILPRRGGANADNVIALGSSGDRFDDAFVTNGVTTGSDENEKQQIASLTNAEMTAAKAISALFKTFKWNDAVAAKGDAARTHTGVIAQKVQTAMSDAGLDASKYAFWCSDTWWEADEKYTDDDGAEQTHTKVYNTADEAPEGATQRTRLGIRYPELLAFVGAATEQRLADIETRLVALEAAE